ncbi:hypothetical protein LX32DRAFT_206337 [Colletotrichum zoysiae]|uniref:Uncharacterized protein n=1 Tax=Colletotrichum zoysiae TaxID=1216348 RepID=A0AAD9H6D1_9PEZI|nr:hypothetical protein LX32DRAFT_206337 [Colletotrichum zoysiae]
MGEGCSGEGEGGKRKKRSGEKEKMIVKGKGEGGGKVNGKGREGMDGWMDGWMDTGRDVKNWCSAARCDETMEKKGTKNKRCKCAVAAAAAAATAAAAVVTRRGGEEERWRRKKKQGDVAIIEAVNNRGSKHSACFSFSLLLSVCLSVCPVPLLASSAV